MSATHKVVSKPIRRVEIFFLVLIVILAIVVRLYKINSPLADWHSWRQADTASVARNFVRNDFDLLHPRFDDLSNIPSGKDNPQGYRFVEFPFYNGLMATFFKVSPIVPIEVYGRIISIFFSMVLLVTIYGLARSFDGAISALFSTVIFAVMPFSIYYSRVVLPDMTALALMFVSILALYRFTKVRVEKKKSPWWWYTSACLLAALSLLIKPTVIFYFLVHLYLFHNRYGLRLIEKINVYLFFVLALIPFGLWRAWISQFPEGIPAASWLITTVQTFEGPKKVFFRPAFFRWIFMERLAILITGAYGLVLLFLGVINKKRSFFSLVVGISALIYLFTFQGGNVQHDYYQIMIIPSLALLSGIGAASLIEMEKTSLAGKLFNIVVITVILFFSTVFSFYKVKDYYSISQQLLSVAKVIRTVTPEEAIIATDRDGDTTLLYLSDRKGFPALTHDPATLKQKGIQYIITTNKEKGQQLQQQFKAIFENEEVFLFRL